MIIQAQATFMEHEGGTKFYNVFQFTPSKGRSVTVTHYGPKRGSTRRPVSGGQTQVKVGRLMNSIVAAKQKRGYSTEDLTVESFQDDDEWFVQTFGAAQSHDIHVAMFEETIRAEIEPTTEPDNEIIPGAIAPPETRPENWGSW